MTDRLPDSSAPPAPSRVRVIRPQFYRSSTTGSLPPDVRDCLIALATVADDGGWLLWNVDELATTIYPDTSPAGRVKDLERRAERLVLAGLLVLQPCGCALLPSLKEHHGLKSGRQTTPVWGWHMRHASVLGMPRNSEEHSSSSSSSGSGSDSVRASSSSSAREDETTPAVCVDCRRPTNLHRDDCPVRANPALLKVVG